MSDSRSIHFYSKKAVTMSATGAKDGGPVISKQVEIPIPIRQVHTTRNASNSSWTQSQKTNPFASGLEQAIHIAPIKKGAEKNRAWIFQNRSIIGSSEDSISLTSSSKLAIEIIKGLVIVDISFESLILV